MYKLKKISKISKFILIFIIIFCIFFSVPSVLAKYVYNDQDERIVSSSKFYFNSSFQESYSTGWDGVSNFNTIIDISNYENKLLFTDSEIKYNVIVNKISNNFDNIDFNIKDKNGNIVNLDDTFTLSGGNLSKDNYYIEFSPKSVSNGDKYDFEVIFKSVLPYEKEIKIKLSIVVEKVNSFDYFIKESNNSSYVVVNLKVNKNLTNNIEFKYNNSSLMIDKNNSIISNSIITKQEGYNIVQISKDLFNVHDSYDFIFIKTNSNFDKDNDLIVK